MMELHWENCWVLGNCWVFGNYWGLMKDRDSHLGPEMESHLVQERGFQMDWH